MDNYEINIKTCAILRVSDKISKVIEGKSEYLVNMNTYDIMENSCQYYGSSCSGRMKGTKMILGSSYKVPIIIEETNSIIFFPTESPSSTNCSWLSLNNILKYESVEGGTKVYFTSGKDMIVNMTLGSFEMQILRANRLETLIKKRI